MRKTAIISGICGQDGSYLAEHLLGLNYRVFGLKRRTSGNGLGCSAHLDQMVDFVEADVTDPGSLNHICKLARADEFYNLAAQSHVGTSFIQPAYTMEVNAKGTLNCLEAIRQSGLHTRFYQASTSEMFGGDLVDDAVHTANEDTRFNVKSPYAASKECAHNMVRVYRESYKMFACAGLLFNHESPRRGPNFVTRKITLAIGAIKRGEQKVVKLGNIDMRRDWGHARDYVRGMHMILTNNEPKDYVLATGRTHTVRYFCRLAFEYAGLGDFTKYVEIDPALYRPNEVPALLGDASRAQKELGWRPQIDFPTLVAEMVDADA